MVDTKSQVNAQAVSRFRLNRLDWFLLLAVLAVGIFFRLWQQGQVPPGMNFDEAFESLEARRLLLDPGYHPIYFTGNWGIPPIEIYLTALAFLIAGEKMLAIRYVSAIAGMVTIPALYFLARWLFPVRAETTAEEATQPWGESRIARQFLPAVACLILAVLPWHNAFSREGVEVVLVPLWTILAVLFLWQGLQTQRWWPFVASGLFWGSAFYTYQAAWVFPGVLVLFVIYKVFQERGFVERYAWKLLLLVLVAAVVIFPLGEFAYRNPWMFFMRTQQVGVFGTGGGSQTPMASMLNNAGKVAGVFLFAGPASDGNRLYTRPPLPLFLALTFYFALLLAVARARRPAYALLLIWCLWMWLPSILADDAPSIRRMIGSLPAIMILVAAGLGWLFDAARALLGSVKFGRKAGLAAAGVALSGLLLYTGVWGYQYFFIDWGRDKNLFHIFDVGLVDIGKYAAATPAGTRLYYTPAGERSVMHLPVTWQVRDRDLRLFDGNRGLVLAPPSPDGALYMVTTFLGDQQSLAALREAYPSGRIVHEVRNYWGLPHSAVFAVDPGVAPVIHPNRAITAEFAEGIELLGSTVSASELHPGETLTVTLFLRSNIGPTKLRHTVFTHLLGPRKADGGILWAGYDSPPLGNSYPTDRWDQGEIIVDQHTLGVPADAPPGTYEIEMGFYTPSQEGVRLKVLGASGRTLTDSVILGTVVIK